MLCTSNQLDQVRFWHLSIYTLECHCEPVLLLITISPTNDIQLLQVIPMLPDILSQHLCSLQPCADRLAFSVLLTVRSSGEIKKTWFGRSIIRSCAKLSYDQALALLEHSHLPIHDPKMKELAKLLPIPESPFRLTHVRDSLIKLNEIARNLRKQRIANGALTLQKCKIEFDLPSATFDPDPTEFVDTDAILHNRGTVWPRGYSVQAPSISHQLIEEWMLAANQAVARRLFAAYKDHLTTTKPHWPGALLRRHNPPSKEHIKEIANLLSSDGITLQDGSSRSISATLYRHNERLIESGCSDKERKAVMDALSHLIYLRMKMATYFSLDDLLHTKSLSAKSVLSDPEAIFQHTWHYGLSVPLYTHFTSPIRRYADLLVHRQLDAILSQSSNRAASVRSHSTHLPLLRLAWKAAWCNNQRMMSRRAQEASQQLFLTACIRDCGPLRMDATVLDLTNSNIKVFLSDFGVIISCALKKFMIHTQKWDVITIDRQDDSDASTSSSAGKQPGIAVIVECDSETTQQPSSSDRTVSRKEFRCLSVIPCRVYSRNDRLVMHAEYFPNDDPSESDDMEHHDSVSP
ncbi:unnamed protein product [Dicrocoelium dendriticum]|nr:unnamed protein product [Dicrocoelium dendriticum]